MLCGLLVAIPSTRLILGAAIGVVPVAGAEPSDANCIAGRITADGSGPEATEFARSTMVGQRVALQTDPTQDRTDRFARAEAHLVRANGWDYPTEAARAGAAKSYVYKSNPVSHHTAITAGEQEARATPRGLWGSAALRRNSISSPVKQRPRG